MSRASTAALVLLIAGSASAQPENVVREPDKAIFRMRSNLDFSAVAVEVTIAKPAAGLIPVRRPGIFKNLIKIRGSFAPELQKSVDCL